MEAVLEAVRRDQFGRNNAGRLRRQGQIPAVVYGGVSGQAESVAVDPKQLLRILHSDSGANTLITVKVAGQADARVLVKEYQLHPVSHQLLHVDFYRIAMDQKIEVTVPIHLLGEAKNAKAQGGTVDFVHREIVVECLPADIPEHITIDISDLGLHDAVRVRDLAKDGKWTPVTDPDVMVVHVVAPRSAEEAPADAATAAEPEVIKKGKADEKAEKDKA
jgi:large subunit ribosomal protein L25